MAEITQIKLKREIFEPKLLPLLEDYSHRWLVFKGSAGSGKSYFITQRIIYRCIKEPIRVMVCRRYGTTLRNSCFALFKQVLAKWKLSNLVKIRETDFTIQFPNGSEIIMVGLDNEEKLLSLADISTVWIEEAFEVSQDMVEQLNLRMRGKAKNQEIIMSFNPISQNHWLYHFCVESPPDSFYLSETTYKDNPFLTKEYIDALEGLKDRNPQKYNIYALGLWGTDPEGLVFTNWRIETFDPMELAKAGLEERVGIDFGWIDPSTCARSLYDRGKQKIYVFDEYYASGIQLDEFVRALDDMGMSKHTKIWCDSAEPRSISFLRSRGYNAVPCVKGKDSIKARITFLQNHEIIVSPNCVNMIRELSNFSYIKKEDRYTEETTHEYSHICCDGLGYAYSDIYTTSKLRTLDKNVLGL